MATKPYIKIPLIIVFLLSISGCFDTLQKSTQDSHEYKLVLVTPTFWTQQATKFYEKISEEKIFLPLPLIRICAFAIPWIWLATIIYVIKEDPCNDLSEMISVILFSPLSIGLLICIFVAFFVVSTGLISFSITGGEVYIIDPTFLFFLCVIFSILFAVFYIFAPLLHMIEDPSSTIKFVGTILSILNFIGLLFTIVDITRLFL